MGETLVMTAPSIYLVQIPPHMTAMVQAALLFIESVLTRDLRVSADGDDERMAARQSQAQRRRLPSNPPIDLDRQYQELHPLQAQHLQMVEGVMTLRITTIAVSGGRQRPYELLQGRGSLVRRRREANPNPTPRLLDL